MAVAKDKNTFIYTAGTEPMTLDANIAADNNTQDMILAIYEGLVERGEDGFEFFVEPGQLVDRRALGSVHTDSKTKNRICVEHSPRNVLGPAEFSGLCGLGLSRRRNAG